MNEWKITQGQEARRPAQAPTALDLSSEWVGNWNMIIAVMFAGTDNQFVTLWNRS